MKCHTFVNFSFVIFVTVALSGCSTLDRMLGEQRPDASIISARLSDLNAESATVTFDVRIDNPYGIDLPIMGIDFGLSNEGRRFLSGAMNEQGSVPARGNKVLPIVAKIPFREALRVLTGVKPGAVIPYEAEFGLKLDVPSLGEYRVPLKRSGTFPVPAIPQISISDFKWEKLDLSGAVANIAFKFGNTNQFPVSLKDLGYDFELAGKRVFRGAIAETLNLAPGKDGAFNLRLELGTADLGLAAFRMLTGNQADYGFVGNAVLGSQFGDIALPVDNRGKTKMRR